MGDWQPIDRSLHVKCTHFVGFRDDRYLTACRIFGPPDFIHMGWDRRAQREIAPGDVVVFADGDGSEPPCFHSYPDIFDPPPPPIVKHTDRGRE